MITLFRRGVAAPTPRQGSFLPSPSRRATSERIDDVANYARRRPGFGWAEQWQKQAFHYERIIGEVGQAGGFLEFAADKLLFRAGMVDRANPRIITDDPNRDAQWLANEFNAGPKGRAARLLFITAETHLIVRQRPNASGFIVDAASVSEIEVASNSVLLRRHPTDAPDVLWTDRTPAKDRPAVIRVWREDAEYRDRAYGWMGRCKDSLEALVLLTLADKAVSLSRLAGAGIVYLPDEAVLPQLAPVEGEDADPSILDRLYEAMIVPIQDRANPDSLVPIVLTGPAEYAQAIKHITFERSNDPDAFTKRRQEHLRAVATASDMPAARFLNTETESKFWNAWTTDKDTSRNFVVPYGKMVANALVADREGDGLYRHLLRQLGHPCPERATLIVDDSQVVSRPENGQQAILLRQMGILKARSTVEACGFTADDLMEIDSSEFEEWAKAEETRRRRYVRENPRDRNQDGTADGTNTPIDQTNPDRPSGGGPLALPQGQTPPANPVTKSGPGGDTPFPSTEGLVDDRVNKADRFTVNRVKPSRASAVQLPDRLSHAHGSLLAAQRSLIDRIHARAESALLAALRAAGAKVASVAGKANHRDPAVAAVGTEVSARLALIPPEDRHTTCAQVGQDLCRRAGLSEDDLLAAAFVTFAAEFRADLLASHATFVAVLAGLGYEVTDADRSDLADRRDAAVAVILAALLALANTQLYGPLIDERGFEADTTVPFSVPMAASRVAAGAEVAPSAQRPAYVPVVTGPVSYGDDPLTVMALALNDGQIAGYRWIHSYFGAPRHPFVPHLELDGMVIAALDDERLVPDARGAWMRVTNYYAGDHLFCRCACVPVFSFGDGELIG